jgi:hypothetical protein
MNSPERPASYLNCLRLERPRNRARANMQRMCAYQEAKPYRLIVGQAFGTGKPFIYRPSKTVPNLTLFETPTN